MTQIKPSSHGIVVEHKETGLRYATTDANYDSNVHRKVRDLKVDESILSYGVKEARPSFNADTNPDDDDSPESADIEQLDSSESDSTL